MTPTPPRTVDAGLIGRRCVQFALDQLLVELPLLALGYLAARSFAPHGGVVERVWFAVGLIAVMAVVGVAALWAFSTWWPLRHHGQTPAMRWLGLRVVTLDGGDPPLRAYAVRFVLLLIDGFLWGIAGLLVMITSRRHQRLGDIAAGTVVVRA